MFGSKTQILFSIGLTVIWCESVHLVQSWDSDHWSLTTRRIVCSLRSFLDILAQTGARLRYRQNIASIPSTFCIFERIYQKNFFWRTTHQISLLSMCSNHLSGNQKSFPCFFLKSFYPVFLQAHSKSAQSKPIKRRKTTQQSSKLRLSFTFINEQIGS